MGRQETLLPWAKRAPVHKTDLLVTPRERCNAQLRALLRPTDKSTTQGYRQGTRTARERREFNVTPRERRHEKHTRFPLVNAQTQGRSATSPHT